MGNNFENFQEYKLLCSVAMASETKHWTLILHMLWLISFLQNAKTWENCTVGLWSWSVKRTKHAVGQGGGLSQRRSKSLERYSKVSIFFPPKVKYTWMDCVKNLICFYRKHVESGECRLRETAGDHPDSTSWQYYSRTKQNLSDLICVIYYLLWFFILKIVHRYPICHMCLTFP